MVQVQAGAASHICMMNVSDMTIGDQEGALNQWDSRMGGGTTQTRIKSPFSDL